MCGRVLAVGEVRVAVAELGGEVEPEPVGELDGAGDGVAVVREAVGHRVGPEQGALAVAAPLALAAVERGAAADRDEDVLQRSPPRVVRMGVAGRDRSDTERFGQVAQRAVPPRVAPLVWPLQLDEVPLRPEGPRQLSRGVRVPDAEPVARAAREADQSFLQLCQQRRVERRRGQVETIARVRVCRGQQPAEVRVPGCGLHQQRHVRAVAQRHLGAGDRSNAERLRCVRELE